MRTFGKVLAVLGIVVLLLVVTGVTFAAWTVHRSFPQTSGTVTLQGLSGSVDVYRNDRGIPDLYADTPADLFFAQGYVHAQDRFWEMDFRRHITAGRLSELFGKSQLDTDTFLRFRDLCEAFRINVPIIPGILPVTNFAQVQKFSAACGAAVAMALADNRRLNLRAWRP